MKTGIRVRCPRAGFECRGTASVATAPAKRQRSAPRRIGTAALRLRPGASSLVSVTLSRRGAAALRAAGKLKVTIAVSIVGPDKSAVSLQRHATIAARRAVTGANAQRTAG